MGDLAARAVEVLAAPDPRDKVRLSHELAAAWRDGLVPPPCRPAMPDRPARPAQPALVAPGRVKRRKITADPAGRAALLHAIAHIELNAIDLAWDMVARFAGHDMPRAFADDWVGVAAEEATHFALLCDRLRSLGAAYGDLPAHDGLWQAAERTSHDLLARLAIVPMVLEARGLDVTPAMIEKFAAIGDRESVDVLRRIYADEIHHVAAGARWFDELCRASGREPEATWHALVQAYGAGVVRPPFNDAAREQAGLPASYYRATASSAAS
jgi:uncharacterized ferritin-like protein (DUF455 family)